MKKLISLIIAMTMVSSIFAVNVFATEPDPLPTTATVNFEVKVADADQIAAYVEAVGAVPSGYTLYAVVVSQTGLGNWENTSTGNNTAKKRATGWLPSAYQFEIDFGADKSKISADGVGAGGPIEPTDYDWNGTVAYAQFAHTSAVYPLNVVTGETNAVAAGEQFFVWYIPVDGTASATISNESMIVMSDFEANNAVTLTTKEDNISYKGTQSTLSFKVNGVAGSTLSFGAKAEAPGQAPEGEVKENAAGKTGLKDLAGNDVPALSKNYGIAKFEVEALNPVVYDYYVYAEDDKGNSNFAVSDGTITDKVAAADFKIKFGSLDIDSILETEGDVSFYAIVRSSDRVIKTITLIKEAK